MKRLVAWVMLALAAAGCGGSSTPPPVEPYPDTPVKVPPGQKKVPVG